MADWSHDGLQADLAEFRRECGEIVVEKLAIGSWGHGGEADVVALKPSWSKPMPTIYEVKVSRSDFNADVGRAKFERYLPHCRRLYFATPAGMLAKDDIPVGMGLTVRSEKGWSTVVAPRLRKVEAEPSILLRGMLHRVGSTAPWRQFEDRAERIRRIAKAVEEQENLRWLSQRIAPEVARALDDAEGRARDARSELRRAEQSLRRTLGLNPYEDETPLDQLVERLVEGYRPEGLGRDTAARLNLALDGISTRVEGIRNAINGAADG